MVVENTPITVSATCGPREKTPLTLYRFRGRASCVTTTTTTASFGAVYCLYDDHEYLAVSLESVKNSLQKVLFLMSDVPWNGSPSDNSKTKEVVKCLCDKHEHFQLIEGHWENEIDQRNFGLTYFSELGVDYCFIIDSDEIYHPEEFDRIKMVALMNPQSVAFHVEWNTYWTKQYFKIWPREEYRPLVCVKTNSFCFNSIRHGTTAVERHGSVVTPKGEGYNCAIIASKTALCYHLSYARNDDYMRRKLETNSHAKEFIKDWYEKVWLKWTPDMKDLHPINPPQYPQAVEEDLSLLPTVLQEFIARERTSLR